MSIIVQKFGGTSVGNGERLAQVANIIGETLKRKRVIAVVSAMSGTVKSKGTTNLLLQAGDSAVLGKSFQAPLAKLKESHLEALSQAVRAPKRQEETRAWLEDQLEWLTTFLGGIQVIRELSPRSTDILVATGERLSAWLLTATLQDQGIAAEPVDLTYAVPEKEREVDPAFFRRVQKHLASRCKPARGKVPVVTGFFGMVPGGLLRTVGRGYTDFTSALISAGLGRETVEELQVWKEVDGVFTADPRRVKSARVLKQITPTEASELTYFGSEVLHPFTMERLVAAKIPIRIKNTFNPEGSGTVIARRDGKGAKAMRVTAVTAKRGITVVTVTSNRMYNAYGFLAGVFNTLEGHGVVVDLVSTSEVSISFTVDRQDEIEKAHSRLQELGTVKIAPGRAILAMVGEGMKYAKGTAGMMFSSLGANGVNIEMISQGASEINISCVVTEKDVEKGLKAVHHAFMEPEPGAAI